MPKRIPTNTISRDPKIVASKKGENSLFGLILEIREQGSEWTTSGRCVNLI